MCLSAVGTVVGLETDGALVEIDGLVRRARILIEPAVALGDLVLVGLGTVLYKVDPHDQAALEQLYRKVGTPLDPNPTINTASADGGIQ